MSDFPLSLSHPSSTVTDTIPMVINSKKSSRGARLMGAPTFRHFRGFTVDSSFFSNLEFVDEDEEEIVYESGGKQKKVGNHRQSNSMDEFSTILDETNPEMVMIDSVEKFMANHQLYEFALLNPKLIKRYIKVERLRKRVNSLAERVAKQEEENAAKAANNKKLKLSLEARRQKLKERAENTKAMEEKLQRLREETTLLGAIVGYPPFGASSP